MTASPTDAPKPTPAQLELVAELVRAVEVVERPVDSACMRVATRA